MAQRHRLITNETDRLMLVFVEPECWDYWLLPGESAGLRAEVCLPVEDFEIVVTGEGIIVRPSRLPAEDFEIVNTDNGMIVWPSEWMGMISLWQGDREMEWGDRRPAG